MTTKFKINATLRDENLNPRQIRANGFIPVTIYGKGMESISAQVKDSDFILSYRDNKEGLYTLELGKKSFEVQVQNVQKNYATNEVQNIEFKVL